MEKKKKRTSKKTEYSYLDKYNALKNDLISIKDLQILMESSYDSARIEMLNLIDIVVEYNKNNPNRKYRFSSNPYKIPKKIVLEKLDLDENYIFKKTKEELQLKNLIG